MINQLLHFFLIGVSVTQIRLVSLMEMHTCRNTESVLHVHKDICKEFNYYGLLYKCVFRHFIINWNLTSLTL